MKKFLMLVVLVLVAGGTVGFFLRKHISQEVKNNQFIYNQEDQKWEEYKIEDVVGKDRKSIVEILAKAAEQLLLSL